MLILKRSLITTALVVMAAIIGHVIGQGIVDVYNFLHSDIINNIQLGR